MFKWVFDVYPLHCYAAADTVFRVVPVREPFANSVRESFEPFANPYRTRPLHACTTICCSALLVRTPRERSKRLFQCSCRLVRIGSRGNERQKASPTRQTGTPRSNFSFRFSGYSTRISDAFRSCPALSLQTIQFSLVADAIFSVFFLITRTGRSLGIFRSKRYTKTRHSSYLWVTRNRSGQSFVFRISSASA